MYRGHAGAVPGCAAAKSNRMTTIEPIRALSSLVQAPSNAVQGSEPLLEHADW
jgi:hypothetical protein